MQHGETAASAAVCMVNKSLSAEDEIVWVQHGFAHILEDDRSAFGHKCSVALDGGYV
jgi:hypothetical protein